MSDFYGEWIHRGCGGNLVIEVDTDEKEEFADFVFRLKCTECEYVSEFARLSFELEGIER